MVKVALKRMLGKRDSGPTVLSPFQEFLAEKLGEDCEFPELEPFAFEPRFFERVGRAEWLKALQQHYKIQAFDLDAADVSPQVALVIPKELGELHRVACVALDERGITLAMVQPTDQAAVREVEARTDFAVRHRVVVPLCDLQAFQAMLYGTARNLEVSPRDIVDQIFQRALQARASDVHIEPLEDEIMVRFRQDGVLVDAFDIRAYAPKKTMIRHLKSALAVVIKNKSGSSGKTMNIAETQRPQDGRIYLAGRNIDMRVSMLPTVHGESVVVRIHSGDSEREELAGLGFSPGVLSRFEPLIRSPYGIFLVSGPTGSGKTTTLYTVLRRLNCPEKKILTIEDPVEYQIPGVMQIQTNQPKDLSFASALRSFLRHDPDIIMVGEIRDAETAVMAVEASLTGHLVLSTVHANDAVRTITRLRDLGVQPMLIASTCLGTMAQRLIRLNCPSCAESCEPPARFATDAGAGWRRGRGCPDCSHTGYRGRTAIHELMVMTPELRDLILAHAPDSELIACARSQGMRLLVEDAMERAARGETSEAEILRVTLQEHS